MRRIVARLLSAVLLGAVFLVAPSPAVQAISTQTYQWRNVQIVGGGFMPGIIYNETEPGLVYARADIGGAYRMDNTTGRWVPLLDWVGWEQWGWTGVVSLATDPVDPNRVYAAAGTYTNDWDPNNGAILRSANRGATWAVSPLPFKLGGNMPGRSMGERLAIDPNRNDILYFGTPKDGLWRSTDSGVTWSKLTSFPNPGDYIQDPAEPNNYLNQPIGVVSVTFDKRTGSAGNATQTIYVGVADKDGTTIYRTINGGSTWELVPGQPTKHCCPQHAVLDHVNGQLYVTYSNTPGPYDGSEGDVWRLDTASGAWTRISPMPSDDSNGDNYFGYGGLTVDRQNPNVVMITSFTSWWPDEMIWRSTDRGTTWTRIWDWTRYPNRSFRYKHDISAAPWLDWGGAPSGGRPGAEVYPKLGWMVGDLEIDPFNSNQMMYVTGATVYGSDDLTSWDAGQQITIKVKAQGIEETAIQELVSPPSGPPLFSGMYDVYGFTHTNLDAVPSAFYRDRIATTTIDYAELNPAIVWRAGSPPEGVRAATYSTNSGSSWTSVGAQPTGTTNGGTIAVGANASRVVWSPDGAGVHYTSNSGKAWTASSGIPTGAQVRSDRVNPNKFYGFANGTFYVSTNGGQSFTATAATGLPASGQFKVVPGVEGHIWLAGGTTDGVKGMWRSTDSGASFTKLANVEEADTIGFGKAAPGQSYMALYTSAKIGGVRGIYRSDNQGATWVRVNDDQNQWAWTGKTITGDPRVYGRVYIGTNGRGIIYGGPA
ncbi:WD40/YVTN/BNR-like repeat-containing protein [Allorhizocola rhizosphaerae]|uniref:WD40/YVTN/BNR-like repeat-containing protein n=1 Tax=Allorhizocola rhizosphaerae TaxID=1872709 RepID=UPI000E3B87E2|nr:xyloglucanase [Allorhizocola rhizosphaerae]